MKLTTSYIRQNFTKIAYYNNCSSNSDMYWDYTKHQWVYNNNTEHTTPTLQKYWRVHVELDLDGMPVPSLTYGFFCYDVLKDFGVFIVDNEFSGLSWLDIKSDKPRIEREYIFSPEENKTEFYDNYEEAHANIYTLCSQIMEHYIVSKLNETHKKQLRLLEELTETSSLITTLVDRQETIISENDKFKELIDNAIKSTQLKEIERLKCAKEQQKQYLEDLQKYKKHTTPLTLEKIMEKYA